MNLLSIEWSYQVKVTLLIILLVALFITIVVLIILLLNKGRILIGNRYTPMYNKLEEMPMKTFAIVQKDLQIVKRDLYESRDEELLSVYYNDEYAVGEYVEGELSKYEDIHPLMKSFGKFVKTEKGMQIELFDEPVDVVCKLKFPLTKGVFKKSVDMSDLKVDENENQYVLSLNKNYKNIQLGVIEKNQNSLVVKINNDAKVLKQYAQYKEEIIQLINQIKESYISQ